MGAKTEDQKTELALEFKKLELEHLFKAGNNPKTVEHCTERAREYSSEDIKPISLGNIESIAELGLHIKNRKEDIKFIEGRIEKLLAIVEPGNKSIEIVPSPENQDKKEPGLKP